MDKECGKCRHNQYDVSNSSFYCNNEVSENYGYFIMYDDTCEEFEEKEDED